MSYYGGLHNRLIQTPNNRKTANRLKTIV